MAKSKEVVLGRVFNMLTVIAQRGAWCDCKCSCGTIAVNVRRHNLLNGNNKSCGCRKRSVIGEYKRTHGRSNSRVVGYADRTYGIWQAMKDRCNNPNRHDWHRYGGAGIKVCDAWNNSFEQFVKDMGEAPEKLSLDRIDGLKGYSLENCKWATYKEQALNTKTTIVYEMGGVLDSITGWMLRLGLTRLKTIRYLDINAVKVGKGLI